MDKNTFPNINPQNNPLEGREQVKTEYFVISIASKNHPEKNEDETFADHRHLTCGILDGVGGHSAGEVASKIACDYILSHLNEIPNSTDIDTVKQALLNIVLDANKFVYDTSKTKKEYAGMGTTATILKIHTDAQGKNYALVANIGDSRVYKISPNGTLRQITTDDDILGNYITDKETRIKTAEKLANAKNINDLEQNPQLKDLFDKRKFITKALGVRAEIQLDIDIIPFEKGARFLLTSDGIHDNLTTDEIQEVITESETSAEIILNLKDKTIERSEKPTWEEMRAKRDDMSAMIVDILN